MGEKNAASVFRFSFFLSARGIFLLSERTMKRTKE